VRIGRIRKKKEKGNPMSTQYYAKPARPEEEKGKKGGKKGDTSFPATRPVEIRG